MSQASTERTAEPVPSSVHAALRALVAAHGDGWCPDRVLAAVARTVADDARRSGAAAERMLVEMKTAWSHLDVVCERPAVETRDLLERLVTLAIRAYYDQGADDGRDAAADAPVRSTPARGRARSAA